MMPLSFLSLFHLYLYLFTPPLSELQVILRRSSEVFHPVLAAVEPSVLIGGGVEGGVLVHAGVDQVLRGGGGTSVNLPLMPLSLGAGTEWGGMYAWIRPGRCAAQSSCKRPSLTWPRILSLPLFYCLTFHEIYFITQGGDYHRHLNIQTFPHIILLYVITSSFILYFQQQQGCLQQWYGIGQLYTSRQLIDITPMKQSLQQGGRPSSSSQLSPAVDWSEKYLAKERMIRLILKEEWIYDAALPRNIGFQLYRPDLNEHPSSRPQLQLESREQTLRLRDLLEQGDCSNDPSSFLHAVVLPLLVGQDVDQQTLSALTLYDFAPEPKPHKRRNQQ